MDYLAINKKAWNQRTRVHVESKFYDVAGFLKGNNPLNSIELEELGDVNNKSLLHLQCHFGLDTLGWARLGAHVTGVDLSSVAIEKANHITQQAQLNADFICSDVYEFGHADDKKFDIVFTSYGALCWLPCLKKWAHTVANRLKDDGTFYIAEFHPIYDALEGYSYFHNSEPDVEESGTYTENCTGETATMASWGHPLSDVINALIQEGIQIEHVNEYPYSPYNCFDNMVETEPNRFCILKEGNPVPLIYTIKGTKKPS